MTKTRWAEANQAAEDLLPPKQPDGSKIGVNYVDAFLKGLNVELEDGRKVSCKRKGLKILLSVGDASGEALMRRIEFGPDPRDIFKRALKDAAESIGLEVTEEDAVLYLSAAEGSES